jgi:nucleoside-diphosphate-sugar epimerase
MRYGVLADIAGKVLRGDEIDVTTGHVNVIWQGDANSQVLRALGHCSAPPNILNISGPETISVRWAAEVFAEMLGKKANIVGQEAETGWLTNNAKSAALFGYPSVPLKTMMGWTADWVARGQHSLGKKTNFEVRDGKY